jgi:hypothetical protein
MLRMKKEPGVLQTARETLSAIADDPMMLWPVLITIGLGLAVALGFDIWWK